MLTAPDINHVSYGTFGYQQGITALDLVLHDGVPLLLSAGGYGTGLSLHQVSGSGRGVFQDDRAYSGQINPFSQVDMAVHQNGSSTQVFGIVSGQGRIWRSDVTHTGLPGSTLSLVSIGGGQPVDPTDIAVLGDTLILSQDNGDLLAFAINFNGSLSLRDIQSAPFSHVTQIAAGEVGRARVVVAVSATENAVASYVIDGSGALRLRDTAGALDGLGLGAPNLVEMVDLRGRSFAIVGAAQSGSLTVFRVDPSGLLTPTDHVTDTLGSRFGRISSLEVVAHDGQSFVIAGGPDDGLTVLALTPDGGLVHLTSFADTDSAQFDNLAALAAHANDDRLAIFGTSATEPGTTSLVYDLSTFGGVLMPDVGDNVIGTPQDDILVSGPNGDILTGHAGADLFVLRPGTGMDLVTDYRPGVDRLDLSNVPFLYGVSQLTVVSTDSGARILFGTFEAQIDSWNGASLRAQDLTLETSISHHFTGNGPAVQFNGVVVNGTQQADRLEGTQRADLIKSLDGNDTIMASEGADMLDGGGGFDTLSFINLAGRVLVDFGADVSNAGYLRFFEHGHAAGAEYANFERVVGGQSQDQLRGSDDRDVLDGGLGWDRVYGRAGNDRLYGGPGGDAIYGNRGADTMTGGEGAVIDRFIYFTPDDTGVGAGQRDVITDFRPGEDRIEISRFDADLTQPRNQAFSLIHTSQFSGAGAELRYHHSAGDTIVQGDMDGDRQADFEIQLTGVMHLSATDFLL